jgi:hypothetical protein
VSDNASKLAQLVAAEVYHSFQRLPTGCTSDSVCPGNLLQPSESLAATTPGSGPAQNKGWCESCQRNTVQSG